MPAGMDMTLIGDRALLRKLQRLDVKLQRKIARHALRAGGRPVLAEAKRLCPVGAHKEESRPHLRDTLKLRALRGRRGQVGVQVQTGTRETLNIPAAASHFWPAAVEFGHGNVPAQSYLRAAVDNRRDASLALIRRDVAAGIESEARKR